MLAGADYVIMGAGIPMEVPGILDALAKNADCKLVIDVDGSEDVIHYAKFSPTEFWTNAKKPELAKKELKRPNFLPIVSSVMLAQAMLKRASGAGPTKGIQGFVIELPTAGGHNAPPPWLQVRCGEEVAQFGSEREGRARLRPQGRG